MCYDIYLGCFEDFLHAYAGLSVDGLMIAEFANQGLEQKQTMKSFSTSYRCISHAHSCVKERYLWLDAKAISNCSKFGFGSYYKKDRLGRRGIGATDKHPSIIYTLA